MKTYKVPRPSQEHIKKMLTKAKEVSKKQTEVLETDSALHKEGAFKTNTY